MSKAWRKWGPGALNEAPLLPFHFWLSEAPRPSCSVSEVLGGWIALALRWVMVFEAEREAGVPVEWSQAWLRVCGFLEQAKWRPTTFLCRDTNPFFVLISSVGLHSLSNIGLRLQPSLFCVLRHFPLSVVYEEAPMLV